MSTTTTILDELSARGLLADCTHREELAERLAAGPIRGYCGFDPTADSLHVGSLLSLAVLRLWMAHGHDVVALVGGATGMIGDPSGKSRERNLLDEATLDRNRAALTEQIERLLTHDGLRPQIIDNREWFADMTVLSFLRDIGKLMPLSDMLERASVRERMQCEGGMSFTEFSYSALQAHDFAHLRATDGCELQMGGSDQWGNIVAGTDMIRRRGLGRAWGLVWPLMTKADGRKFGKTEDGNVWLSAERTSPFAFHQFWLGAADADVEGLLLKFTLLGVDEVAALMEEHRRDPRARVAQRRLADEVTTWVHGAEGCAAAHETAETVFGPRPDAAAIARLEQQIPTVTMARVELPDLSLEDLMRRTALAETASDARRALQENAVYIDNHHAGDAVPIPQDDWLLVRRGRRRHALVRLVGGG